MLANSPAWNASSTRFETVTLPRCWQEWSREFLPAGMTRYPALTCVVAPEWSKTCSKAGGLIVTVTAEADFANTVGQVATRVLMFPACVSGGKACTASENAANYMWSDLLAKITSWCQSHVNPSLQCTNAKVSTNFWIVVTWPRVQRILLGVLITLPSLAIVTVIIFCYRRYRKREHDEALMRVELLRKARATARASQGPSLDATARSSMTRNSLPVPTKEPLLPSMRPGETRPLVATAIARSSASPDDAPVL